MKPVIKRSSDRPAREVVELLRNYGTATIHEAMGRQGLMLPYVRPIYDSARVCGTAVTVSCQPGDNLMIHAALDVCKPGDVLIVTVTSESTDGMFGELLGVSARAQGVEGLVIDAGVRDTVELTEMGFPVWAKAVSSKGTVKATPGWVNVPVVCAGALVNPGDIVVGDRDGVVVVPKAIAGDIAKLSEARMQKENVTRKRLADGELGLDIYGLREKLAALGVTYED